MKGMPFAGLETQGVLELAAPPLSLPLPSYWNPIKEGFLEPCSVLDNRRSPNPPTSSSTGGGGGGGGGSADTADVAALSDNNPTTTTAANSPKWPSSGKEEWASELQPIPSAAAAAADEWEAMLSETSGSPTHEQTFLRWIMADVVDDSGIKYPHQYDHQHHHQQQQHLDLDNNSLGLGFGGGGMVDTGFGFEGSSLHQQAPPQSIPVCLPPVPNTLPILFQEPIDQKPHHSFNPGLLMKQHQHQHQHPSFFVPLPQSDPNLILPPNPKRHHTVPHSAPAAAAAAAVAAVGHQQQALVDQLFKAAELVEAGNPFGAREILARLNHQLPPSPLGLKPLVRSAFLFKDVLLRLLANSPNPPPLPVTNPWDVVLKLSSYKAFSEVSPLVHFTNFTCTQTLLEEIGSFDRIHIVDFDIGVGGQWSSFIQELAHRRSPSVPFLKITAFVSSSSFHPLELHLTSDNLSQFASDLHIPFEFTALAIESLNPNELLAVLPNEAVAVNLPIGSHYAQSFPTILKLVKQLNPKVVVSIDQGCDRSGLPFSHHFRYSFQACMVLLDSMDAAGTNADVANKIERLLVQPRVENLVVGRHRAGEKLPPWRALFASIGFVPVQFSNFTETQAECLLKRVQVRGFHVEKRQGALFLYWQRGELGSVSAWRCG